MENGKTKNSSPYKVIESPLFEKDRKDILKKDKTFSAKLNQFVEKLQVGTFEGEDLGKGIFKVRIAKQGKGKSGGYRIIYYVIWLKEVHLVTAYDKSEIGDIPKSMLLRIIKNVL